MAKSGHLSTDSQLVDSQSDLKFNYAHNDLTSAKAF